MEFIQAEDAVNQQRNNGAADQERGYNHDTALGMGQRINVFAGAGEDIFAVFGDGLVGYLRDIRRHFRHSRRRQRIKLNGLIYNGIGHHLFYTFEVLVLAKLEFFDSLKSILHL